MDAVRRGLTGCRGVLGLVREPAPAPIRWTAPLGAYIAANVAVAAVLCAATWAPVGDRVGLAVLALAVFAFAVTSVRFVTGPSTIFSASTFSQLGLAVLFGPAGCLAGGLAEELAVLYRFRTGVVRAGFSAAMIATSGWATWEVATHLLRLPLPDGALFVIAGSGAGLVHFAVNHVLLAGVVSISSHRPFHRQLLAAGPMVAFSVAYGYAGVGLSQLHGAIGIQGYAYALAPVAVLQAFLVMFSTSVQRHEATLQDNISRLEALSADLDASNNATLVALTAALDTRDRETEGHSRRVVEYTRLLGCQAGVTGDALKILCQGALLHDIGKIGVPDRILHKAAPLSEAEWVVMRRHPELGAAIIHGIPTVRGAREVILDHHEHWDGSGYPRGLRGREISVGGRLFAIADAVDAMTQDRPYRRARSLDAAREEVRRMRGTQFDPDAVDAFLAIPEAALLRIEALRDPAAADLLVLDADPERPLPLPAAREGSLRPGRPAMRPERLSA